MTFTATLWQTIRPIYQAILEHPFSQDLMQGSLDPLCFQFYLQQDALYLNDFARTLALIAAKSGPSERIIAFLNFALGAIVAERDLHSRYFALYQIEPTQAYAPGCFTYSHYLLSTAALGSYAEAIAAVLPCFWIYQEVGQFIHQKAGANNPYQAWIDTYAGDDFAQVVQQAITITDEVAETVTADDREMMTVSFVRASQLEWLFWDSAYRQETWMPRT